MIILIDIAFEENNKEIQNHFSDRNQRVIQQIKHVLSNRLLSAPTMPTEHNHKQRPLVSGNYNYE